MCVVATLLLLVGQLTATTPVTAPAEADIVAAASAPSPATDPVPLAVSDVEPPRTEPQSPPQVQTGLIEGLVTDQHQGVIPGARVTLTSAVSAATRTTTTDARGRFVFTALPAGAYDFAISLSGFKTTRGRIQLTSGQRAAMEVRLEIGGITEEVVLRGTMPPSQVSGALPGSPKATGTNTAAAALFDSAKRHYEAGRLAEAEAVMVRALEQVRAELRERQFRLVPTIDPPPDSSQSVRAVRVGGSIREPRKVRNVAPVYPPEAQQAGVQGYVIIEAVIGTDGRVKDARVLGGQSILQEAALEAVKQWEYTPTLLGEVPVEVIMNVTVHFKLGG